ncbi:MAG: glycosyltransferase [Flavobacteriales bacterium]
MDKKVATFDLSVIIVNYNVTYFLEQCLNSVLAASKNLKVQVFVVDNNSVDGSVEMVQAKFPQVKLIANKGNVGFSRANNQALAISDARYSLLLNPDTVVEEDTFTKVVAYMDGHPETGGLGVRMVDGKGRFLPESKRGLPTPMVAFYKIFGLSKLFPKSKKFGRYHLGYLSEFETNEVDVLSGAFMLMRQETLEKVGFLDETFFMYGEDIDLSYRIQLGGYKNVYFPETKIIHYKGESTKKSSVNYVFVFYRAMVIFAKKHFSQNNAKLFSMAIHLAIYLRASLSILRRFIHQISLPAIDFSLSLGGLYLLSERWKMKDILFPEIATHYLIPCYAFIWMFSGLVFGIYDQGSRYRLIFKSIFFGTIFILSTYALLPKEWQFSRLYILLGALVYTGIFFLIRFVYEWIFKGNIGFSQLPKKRFAIIGDSTEFIRIKQLLEGTYPQIDSIVGITNRDKFEGSIGNMTQLSEIVSVHKINEVIFSAKSLSSSEIIHWMTQTSANDLEFKIAQPDTSFLIGSNSIDRAGELYVLNFNSLSHPENKRVKRLIDVVFALLLLLTSPVHIWFFKHKKSVLQKLLSVFIGKKTFVGYTDKEALTTTKQKQSLFGPFDHLQLSSKEDRERFFLIYSRDYTPLFDIRSILRNFRLLDRN